MTISLTAQEKKTIAEQHLKNILFSEYNIELSLLEANAIPGADSSTLDSLNKEMSDLTSKKNVIELEISSLDAELQSNN